MLLFIQNKLYWAEELAQIKEQLDLVKVFFKHLAVVVN